MKQMLDQNTSGRVLLLLGHLFENTTSEEFIDLFKRDKSFLKEFMTKWYDDIPCVINGGIFSFFGTTDWESEDEMTYFSPELNVTLIFEEPTYIADWPGIYKKRIL